MADQTSEVDSSGHCKDLDLPDADGLDILLLHNLPEYFAYRAIHDLVKPYGDVVSIRVTYDRDCPSNRCYVVFAMAAQLGRLFKQWDRSTPRVFVRRPSFQGM